jgi:hypothetical protein
MHDRDRWRCLDIHVAAERPSIVEMARNFEAAMRRSGKPVTAVYYDGSGHNGMFINPRQFDDEVHRTAAFTAQ